jgi:hypothetical protein
MSADDLAALFTFAGKFGAGGRPDTQGPLGFHQGQVVAWDSVTGKNTMAVLGTTVNDVPVLTTADSIMLNLGDTVGMLRFKSTYFLLGRIAPPGAGAALGIRSATVTARETTTSFEYTDLPTLGPRLSDVYIGSSRRCLVFMAVSMTNGAGAIAGANVEVTGASQIEPESTADASVGSEVQVGTSASSFVLLTEGDGLNEGLNTFTMKYYSTEGATGFFEDRKIAIFPF